MVGPEKDPVWEFLGEMSLKAKLDEAVRRFQSSVCACSAATTRRVLPAQAAEATFAGLVLELVLPRLALKRRINSLSSFMDGGLPTMASA